VLKRTPYQILTVGTKIAEYMNELSTYTVKSKDIKVTTETKFTSWYSTKKFGNP
jgi:hypothetical protein